MTYGSLTYMGAFCCFKKLAELTAVRKQQSLDLFFFFLHISFKLERSAIRGVTQTRGNIRPSKFVQLDNGKIILKPENHYCCSYY